MTFPKFPVHSLQHLQSEFHIIFQQNILKCKQSQFFETTYQNFQGFNVSGNTLYLGTNTGGSTLGQNCSGYNFSWKFKVDNLNDVKTLYWNSLILDDSIRVYVNGQSVWSWGNACELGARRGFNPNVDFKPYLKQGGQ